MPTPEGIIKRQICEYLSYQKDIFFWINSSVGVAGRKNHSKFQRNGTADVLGVIQPGLALAIEIKAPKGKLSVEQTEFILKINSFGGLAFVAYSVDDVIKALSLFRAHKRVISQAAL